MKVFTEQEVVQILNHVRDDLHEPYYADNGTQEPVPPLVAMRIAIDRVYGAFGVDPSPSYPVIPPTTTYQYKVMWSGGTITHVEKLNETC